MLAAAHDSKLVTAGHATHGTNKVIILPTLNAGGRQANDVY